MKNRRNILISGGNFVNKGAEAMLYVAVNECLTRYPGSVCVIQLSQGFYAVESLEELNALSKRKKWESVDKLSKLKSMISNYRKAFLMLDVSGYELSSKLGEYPSLRYIFKIALSKFLSTKVILLPQSFGPFEYKGALGCLLKILIKHYMKYPTICFARENDGVVELKRLVAKANVLLSTDMVLQSKKSVHACLENPMFIEPHSVGLVVNRRLYEQYSKEKIEEKYIEIVKCAVNYNHNVYLLCHATDDIDICDAIKKQFSDNHLVHNVNKVLSCFAFQQITKEFDYVIAARYHSIVHSYKEGTPCIALGWAIKYSELLETMGQRHYMINIDNASSKEIQEKIEFMEGQFEKEKIVILDRLSKVQRTNCFDTMQSILEDKG